LLGDAGGVTRHGADFSGSRLFGVIALKLSNGCFVARLRVTTANELRPVLDSDVGRGDLTSRSVSSLASDSRFVFGALGHAGRFGNGCSIESFHVFILLARVSLRAVGGPVRAARQGRGGGGALASRRRCRRNKRLHRPMVERHLRNQHGRRRRVSREKIGDEALLAAMAASAPPAGRGRARSGRGGRRLGRRATPRAWPGKLRVHRQEPRGQRGGRGPAGLQAAVLQLGRVLRGRAVLRLLANKHSTTTSVYGHALLSTWSKDIHSGRVTIIC